MLVALVLSPFFRCRNHKYFGAECFVRSINLIPNLIYKYISCTTAVFMLTKTIYLSKSTSSSPRIRAMGMIKRSHIGPFDM